MRGNVEILDLNVLGRSAEAFRLVSRWRIIVIFDVAEFTFGWWRLTDPHEIVELEASLNVRGVRENQLLQNLRRNVECVTEATRKPLPEHLELEEPENFEKPEMLPFGCAIPDHPG